MSIPSFLSAKHVTQEVNGESHKFYPISTLKVFRLRTIGRVIAKALQTLFSGANDTGHKSKTLTEGGTGEALGAYQKEIEQLAIDPQLAGMRHQQRMAATEELVETLLNDEAKTIVAELIIDSMRDAFPNRKPGTAQIAEFLENTSVTCFSEMLVGLVEANKAVFSPLAKRAEGLVAALKARLQPATDEPLKGPTPQTATSPS